MGLDLTGFGAIADAVTNIVNKFVPDKSQAEKDSFALELQRLTSEAAEAQAQLAVDQAEAASPDRINHWRGGLGWAIVFGIMWHYVLQPMAAFGCALVHYPVMLPDMSVSELYPLLFAMLGVTGAHVYQQVKTQ